MVEGSKRPSGVAHGIQYARGGCSLVRERAREPGRGEIDQRAGREQQAVGVSDAARRHLAGGHEGPADFGEVATAVSAHLRHVDPGAAPVDLGQHPHDLRAAALDERLGEMELRAATFAERQRVLAGDHFCEPAVGAHGHQRVMAPPRAWVGAERLGDGAHGRRGRPRVEDRQVLANRLVPRGVDARIVPRRGVGELR